MDTYKLFRIYEQKKEHTIMQINKFFGERAIHYPKEQIIAIRLDDNKNAIKDILEVVSVLDVSQAMFTLLTIEDIILHYGDRRKSMSIEFTDDVSEDFLSIINGYLQRIQNESNELLRKNDMRQLLYYLRMLSTEEDIDIKSLLILDKEVNVLLYNNGVITTSSKESLDQLIQTSF
jgi:hypothetical protein